MTLLSVPLLASCSAQDAQTTLNRAVSTSGLNVNTNVRYGPDARNVMDIYAPANVKGLRRCCSFMVVPGKAATRKVTGLPASPWHAPGT
ncbi:hypothetical protein ACFSC4_06500 [Deinococcus malanensis]|uniref:hypothetical protein n=1 Tax=Deinococcus malanensis TaxID=1706855 RepID=UPI003636301B